MKRLFLPLALMLLALAATAQHAKSSSVYWVVETNIQQPNYSIVRFYDNTNTMVHEVKIDGVYINIRKAKHKKKLDRLVKEYNHRADMFSKKPKSRVDFR